MDEGYKLPMDMDEELIQPKSNSPSDMQDQTNMDIQKNLSENEMPVAEMSQNNMADDENDALEQRQQEQINSGGTGQTQQSTLHQ